MLHYLNSLPGTLVMVAILVGVLWLCSLLNEKPRR